MTASEMTQSILTAKAAKQQTWANIAQAVGLSEVFTTSACLGQNSLSTAEAERLGALLELTPDCIAAIQRPALKGESAPTVPKEPLAYRFQEIIYVYGETMKELIEEKFGPGIMSAIDFTMTIDRVPDPKGDRVQIVMNGKFLGYKKW